MRLNGLGETDLYPAQPGVSRENASKACSVAGGLWDDRAFACSLDTGATLPSWCDSVPLASSLFSACKPPSTAAEIAAYSAYPIYVAAQNHPDDPAVRDLIDRSQTGVNDITENLDCDYVAQQDNPGLYLIAGTSLTRMLTNPFNTGCKPAAGALPGWMLYAALFAAGYAIFKNSR